MSSSDSGMTRLPWDVLELLPLLENIIGERDRDRRCGWYSPPPPCSLLRDETDGWRWIEVPELDIAGELELETPVPVLLSSFFLVMGDCGLDL